MLFADHQTRCVHDRGLLRTRPLFFGKGVLGTNRRRKGESRTARSKGKGPYRSGGAFLDLFILLLYHAILRLSSVTTAMNSRNLLIKRQIRERCDVKDSVLDPLENL